MNPGASLNGSSTKPTTLQQTLNTTQTVTSDVRRTADHLSLINTVLEQDLPEEVQVGDVAQAIDQTGSLKVKLAESADALAEVNEALKIEIEKREKVSEKLDQSQATVEKLSQEVKKARR